MLLTRSSSRHRAVLAVPQLWKYACRLAPWSLIGVSLLLSAACGLRTHLDTGSERSVLAILSTLALCAVLEDPAAAFAHVAPTALRVQRVIRLLPPLALIVVVSAAVLVMSPLRYPGPIESTPTWALILEWATLATSQLIVAALISQRDRAGSPIMPGLFVALVWLTAERLPTLHQQLYPVSDHPALWGALLAIGAAAFCALSRDR